MYFEHKTQALAPKRVFILRVLKYFLFSLLFLSLSLGIGTLGYYYIANLSLIDSLLNASMILTGMGPVSVLTTSSAKLFASIYALYSGVAFLSTVAGMFAPIVHRFFHFMHLEDNS